MKRLLLSTKALWHQWRADRLVRHAAWVSVKASAYARAVLDAAEAHAAEAAMNVLASRSLARGPLPDPVETDQPAGCSFAGRMLVGSIVGLGIAFLWVWISARAGR